MWPTRSRTKCQTCFNLDLHPRESPKNPREQPENTKENRQKFLKKIKRAIFVPLLLTGGTTLPEIKKIAISFNWGIVAASIPVHMIEEIKVNFNFSAEGRPPFRAH